MATSDDRILLVPFASGHFSILASWFTSETELVAWGGTQVRYPLTDDQMLAMLEDDSGDCPARLCWMAAVSSCMIGHAQLVFDWRNGTAAVTRVIVAPEHRRKHFGSAMLQKVVHAAFNSPLIERVELNVYSWNSPAIDLYRKLGFVTEGVRRSSARIGSKRWDTAIMAMLRNEYLSVAQRLHAVTPSRS